MRMYQAGVQGPTSCPGENQCDIWAATAGKTHAEKERKACHGCQLYPTKLREGRERHKRFQRLVTDAMQIRVERLAGYPRPDSRLTALQFQTLLIVEQIIEQEELTIRQRVSTGLTAMMGLAGPQQTQS